MLAVSSWAWWIIAAIGLVSLGLLIQVTIGLITRLKDLNRAVAGASEKLQAALEEMRGDLDETSQSLAALRQAGEEEPDL